MTDSQSRDNDILKNACSLLESKKIDFQKESIVYRNEIISREDHRVVSFKQNDKTIDIVIIEKDDSFSLILKDEFIKKKTLKSFLTVSTLAFIALIVILFMLPIFNGWPKIFLFILPLIFGFLLYKAAYRTAKSYLKKITDTVTFFSAAIAAAAVLCGVNLPQYLYDPNASFPLQIILFIFLQTFSIFATTKCCISWDETIEEGRNYYQENPSPHKAPKKIGILKKIKSSIIGAILFVKITLTNKNS
ncbi:hypothetical protein IFU23_22035 [Pantoea agglomerans]|uniref:hypothetical protein n=1 Tax=Enterobacter agglomerans TaxID=549 RepID=UPI00177F5519|nr:hypothetical protein [Pantoea agglomerans]MBD8160770.1 hypothetical protein [Pantoea agglomerans]